MKYFFIMNPGSRGGKSIKSFNKIFKFLDENSVDYEFKYTHSLLDAYKFSANANKEAREIIIAVGGDGTINNVLNGFFDKAGRRISRAKMGIIYTGTSPDFCKSYSIPIQLGDALKVLLSGRSKKIYVGRLTYADENSLQMEGEGIDQLADLSVRYFGCCTNIGLGASLARRANGGIRKYLGDFPGTFISLMITISKYKANDFTIISDGKEKKISKLYNISVGRTKYIASGIKVNNCLSEDDRRFYSLIVRKITLLNFPGILKKIYSGKEIKSGETLVLDYINQMEIAGNYQNPEIEMDGDPVGYLPCRIEIAEDQLDLIVS